MNFSMKVIWSSLAPICSARGGLVRVDCTRSRESDPVLPQMMLLDHIGCAVFHIFHTHARCASIFLTWRRQSHFLWVTGYAAQLLSHDKTRLLAATLWIKRLCFRNVSRCIITFVMWRPTKPDRLRKRQSGTAIILFDFVGLSCNSFGESVRENVCIDWMQITTWAESR